MSTKCDQQLINEIVHLKERVYKLSSENFLLNQQLLFCNIIISWFMVYKKWFLSLIILKTNCNLVPNLVVLDENLLQIPLKLLSYLSNNFQVLIKNLPNSLYIEKHFIDSYQNQLNQLSHDITESNIKLNTSYENFQKKFVECAKNENVFDEAFFNCLYTANLEKMYKMSAQESQQQQQQQQPANQTIFSDELKDRALKKTNLQLYEYSTTNLFMVFSTKIFTQLPFLIRNDLNSTKTLDNNQLRIENIDSEHFYKNLSNFFEKVFENTANVMCFNEKYTFSRENLDMIGNFVEKNIYSKQIGQDELNNLEMMIGQSNEYNKYTKYFFENIFTKLKILNENTQKTQPSQPKQKNKKKNITNKNNDNNNNNNTYSKDEEGGVSPKKIKTDYTIIHPIYKYPVDKWSISLNTENGQNVSDNDFGLQNYTILFKNTLLPLFRQKIFFIHSMLDREKFYDACYENVYVDNIITKNMCKIFLIFFKELHAENEKLLETVNNLQYNKGTEEELFTIKNMIKNINFGKNEITGSMLFYLNKILT